MTVQERMRIPREEYDTRVQRVQKEMQEEGLDLLIVHSCECESANVRYLTDYWTFFDFAGVVVPREGNAILLTGGPESEDCSRKFGRIDDVRINPLYVETGAPTWDKPADSFSFEKIFDELRQKFEIKRIGIANSNIIPYAVMQEIIAGAKNAEIIPADNVIMRVRWYKSENEIKILREAYKITEKAVREAIDIVKPGVREWEIEAAWRAGAYAQGAEGTSMPVWVTSGPGTYQSLCRSTNRIIEDNELVQLTFGAKYSGYCGILCLPVVLGKLPEKHENMIRVSNECVNETIEELKPGVPFSHVYDVFQERLKKNGFSGLTLYGPAHGTGMQECEGPWVDNRTDSLITPGMVFNIDMWIADSEYGARIEEGVVITETGCEQFTSFRKELLG